MLPSSPVVGNLLTTTPAQSQVDKNVLNIVGLARTGIQDEPLVISVVTTVERAKFRGIIRTKTGDHRFHIPAALVKKKKLKSKVWASHPKR